MFPDFSIDWCWFVTCLVYLIVCLEYGRLILLVWDTCVYGLLVNWLFVWLEQPYLFICVVRMFVLLLYDFLVVVVCWLVLFVVFIKLVWFYLVNSVDGRCFAYVWIEWVGDVGLLLYSLTWRFGFDCVWFVLCLVSGYYVCLRVCWLSW